MDNLSMHSTVTMAEGDREFWHGVLLAGGFTALPRWSLEPVPGVGEHEARIPDEPVSTLRRVADELGVPFSSVLLTAHAKVLAALSGVALVIVQGQGKADLAMGYELDVIASAVVG